MSFEIVAVIAVILLLFLLGGVVYYSRRVITDPHYYARLMNEAAQAIASNDFVTAQKRFLKVLSQINKIENKIESPPPPLLAVKGQALLGMGNLERGSNRLAEALKWYREAMGLIQVPADVVELVALQYVRQKATTPQAVDTYMLFMASMSARAAFIENMSRHPVVAFLQELCRVELVNNPAQLQSTLSFIQRLVSVAPNLDWPYYALGVVQGRLNRPAEGIAALQRAEQLNPARATTPFQLGLLYLAQGQRDLAYDAFKRSLRHYNSPQPQLLYQLTQILLTRVRENGLPSNREELDEASDLLHQTCRSATHQRADIWHLLGQIEWQRHHPQEARAAFEQAVGQEPQNLTYQLALAEVLIGLNDTPAAIASLRQVVNIAPQHLPSQLQLAKLLLTNAQPAEAETHYRKVLELEPNHKEARLAIGRLLYKLGRWAEAANELRQVPDLSQEDGYTLARSFSRASMPAKAVKIYENQLKIYGPTPNIGFHLGCAFAQMSQWSQAVHAFEQAEASKSAVESTLDHLDHHFGPIALYRGMALTYLGEFEQAQAAYQAAAVQAPNHAQIPYAQGMLALQRGDSRYAWQAFSKSLSLDPNYAPAYFGRGLLSEQGRKWSQAIRDYAQGLNRQPKWLPGQARLAIAQAKAGYWSLALASLQRVTQLGMKNDELTFYLALTQAQLDQYEQALAIWQPLYARYPDDKILTNNLTVTYYHLGEQYFESGNYAEAIRYWKQGAQMRPDLAEFGTCLKEAYLRLAATPLSQPNGAIMPVYRQHLQDVLALEPNNTRAHHYLALMALKEGDMERAIKILSSLAHTHPKPHQIRYQLALTHLSEGQTNAAKPLLEELTPAEHLYTPGLQLAQGNLALSEGHWAEAFDFYVSSL